MNLRAQVARTLLLVVDEHRSLSEVLPPAVAQVQANEKALFQELCYGSLRWYQTLDKFVGSLLDKPLKNKDRDIYMLMVCGAYQISFSRIPDHAALNETVGAVKSLGKSWAKGLLNAILRRYLREENDLKHSLDKWHRHSHPQWLVDRLRNAWGEDVALKTLIANNTAAPMTLRNNALQQTASDYLATLQQQDIEAFSCKHASNGIQLARPCSVDKLPGFFEGACSVQDEAAQLCCQILELKDGMRVLDACTAPGGKAGAMLETADIELIALDISARRLERVEENFERLQLQAAVVCADLTENNEWWEGEQFDAILLDAPCSATGVIRRHPDIKLLRTNDDIEALAETQLLLLEKLWPMLKPGGQLLYATCSILPEENEGLINQFLQQESSATAKSIDSNVGEKQEYGLQLLPAINGHDGFYYCLLEKS